MKIAFLGFIAALAALSSPTLASDPVPVNEAPYAKKLRPVQLAADPAMPTKAPMGQDLMNILAICSTKSPGGIPGRYSAGRSGRTWIHVSRDASGKFIVKTKNDFSILVLTEVNSYSVNGMNITVKTMQTTWTASYDPGSKSLSGSMPGGTLTYDLSGC